MASQSWTRLGAKIWESFNSIFIPLFHDNLLSIWCFFSTIFWDYLFGSYFSELNFTISGFSRESFAGQDVAEATEQRKKEHEEFGIPLTSYDKLAFFFGEIHRTNLRFDSPLVWWV